MPTPTLAILAGNDQLAVLSERRLCQIDSLDFLLLLLLTATTAGLLRAAVVNRLHGVNLLLLLLIVGGVQLEWICV